MKKYMLEQILEWWEEAPADSEMVLVISPNLLDSTKVHMDHRYRPFKVEPLATPKQLKLIKQLMQADSKDLYIKHYEDITKSEANNIIRYLLDNDDEYDEDIIKQYKI